MSDYSKARSYAPKDALATGDPLKLILGSEQDEELDAIVVAIATKYDSTDIASQAQAIAGVSNTTLITPLRMAQYLAGGFGGSGAGMLADIGALVDPNADRGLFWDDSADAVTLFSLGTGLNFTGTVLGLTLGSIDHNSLLNWVGNKHIDHTAVSITAGSGLTGGGDISATRTLALSITGLTTDNSPDTAADYVPYYDAGEGANNKILMSSLVGETLGDGKWYLSGAQALSAATEATVVYNAADYDVLVRGSFSTSTGIYTAGAAGARILITATATITALNAAATFELMFRHNSTEKTRGIMRNDADATASEAHISISAVFTLGVGDTCCVRAETSSAESMTTGIAYNSVSIVEIG